MLNEVTTYSRSPSSISINSVVQMITKEVLIVCMKREHVYKWFVFVSVIINCTSCWFKFILVPCWILTPGGMGVVGGSSPSGATYSPSVFVPGLGGPKQLLFLILVDIPYMPTQFHRPGCLKKKKKTGGKKTASYSYDCEQLCARGSVPWRRKGNSNHTVTFLSQGISFKSEQRKLRAVQGELNVQMACCIIKTDN